MTPARWTGPEQVVAALHRNWANGRYLAAAANGHPFDPVEVPLKGPSATDTLHHYDQALAWAQAWAPDRHPRLTIRTRHIGGRNGTPSNTVPDRACVETREHLWALLGVTDQVDRFHALHDQTAGHAPDLAQWMADHPMKVLAHEADWHRLVRTTCWIRDHTTAPLYLRQIDTPGVDTKFIETNKGMLAELLDHTLPEDRINAGAPKSDLAARYGFRAKPAYVRLRHLGASPLPFSELTVRAEELTTRPPETHTVFVLENEITYLCLPPLPTAIAILGSGYAAALLHHLPWLNDVNLHYWGDIDTHGFAILNQVRGLFPHTQSLLMDRTTFLAHEPHWSTEKTQAPGHMAHLTPEEAQLAHDLGNNTYGPNLRLEQERIRISAVRSALDAVTQGCRPA
ncbi:Wadjet anti-phage system protein JetD domain-containing protein [Kitasatospora sp. NPDC059571]|uniref:Wadjet anti-phage system protein JetD domain-containing protein n=1 Tax=Kitasatospora sp. NPDC059571 TaxID=3346871 RepID=UPI003696A48B